MDQLNNFIKKCNLIHYNKYDYSEVIYTNNHTKVKIICPIHGVFYQRPKNHIEGYGCTFCSKTKKLTQDEFIKKAIKKHKNRYSYSEVNYINNHKKVKINCHIHGSFYQTPHNHLKGHGCRKCSYLKNSKISSDKENLWLDEVGIKIRQKVFIINGKTYIVDGFDPETNTVYEFHGDFWHGNPERYNKWEINSVRNKTFGELFYYTKKKEKTLIKAGFNLIVKWEKDWDAERNKYGR